MSTDALQELHPAQPGVAQHFLRRNSGYEEHANLDRPPADTASASNTVLR